MTRDAAPALVEACAVAPVQRVLDVAAGNGNVAAAAARAGASVVASDLTPRLIELGRARCEQEGLEVEWVEADAEELPFADASFDCAMSSFGAMFAPRPERVASELVRVVRSGGTVGMANWTPDSFLARQATLVSDYLPQVPELPDPFDWGREEVARRRFERLGCSCAAELRTLYWHGESADEWISFVAGNAGPHLAAQRRLSQERYAALERDLLELARSRAEGAGPVRIASDYLVVVARTP